MFHIDLSSKRARLALRFFTYGVMTLATVLLTALAVFFAMGYRFNQDFSFQQGGLVQIRSVPQGAQVVVDGHIQGFTTPGRVNLGTGTHTVEMRLNGYRTWQKTVSLAAGQLLWLNYARLLPETITTSNAATFDGYAGALASPDRKWMLVQPKSNQPLFKLVDFNDPKKPVVTDLAIPDAELTKKDDIFGTFAITEWDLHSRYILVEHTINGIREVLRLDRQKASAAVNVSRVFNLNITEAHFAGSNANMLYAKTDAVLRSLDIGASSASAVLVSGVDSFSVYGNDIIAFVGTRNVTEGNDATKQRVVGLYERGKETIVRTYSPDANVHAAYSEYTHHGYLAIDGGTGTIAIVRDPTANAKDTSEVASVKVGDAVDWLKFSSNGRMVVAGRGNAISNYDLDLDKLTAWTISGAPLTQPLQWLDEYYLWSSAGGSLRMFEFDSNNDRTITSVIEGSAVSLSQDGAYLYSFAKNSAGQYALQSSQLVKNN
jgi:hypothetical protein